MGIIKRVIRVSKDREQDLQNIAQKAEEYFKGEAIYAEISCQLQTQNIPFLNDLLNIRYLNSSLGYWYLREDESLN